MSLIKGISKLVRSEIVDGVSTGPVQSLPGHRHAPEKGAMCYYHPDRPATVGIQGETDSFGCEVEYFCDECAKIAHAESEKEYAQERKCEWCGDTTTNCRETRDYEEGLSGRVYMVCPACRADQKRRLNEQWNEYLD